MSTQMRMTMKTQRLFQNLQQMMKMMYMIVMKKKKKHQKENQICPIQTNKMEIGTIEIIQIQKQYLFLNKMEVVMEAAISQLMF